MAHPTTLIRLAPVVEIVEAALWSGKIEGENPLSLCLVAPPQSAKSAAMIALSKTSTVRVYTDITSKPLLELTRDIEKQRIKHIMLLDLHTVVSHNRYTVDRTLQIMAGLMEEGLGTVADGGGTTEFADLPKIGVIMAVTPDFYGTKRGWWRKTGFLSRFLIVHYTYSDDTNARIHHHIRDGGQIPEPKQLKLPEASVTVKLRDQERQAIEDQARQWGQLEKDPAFRYHRQLRRLIRASAAMDGRNTTNDVDFARVITWTPFFRPSQPVNL